MELNDVKWNEEARGKILADADRALQFVDFKPGPDLSKYADAVVNGEIGSASGT